MESCPRIPREAVGRGGGHGCGFSIVVVSWSWGVNDFCEVCWGGLRSLLNDRLVLYELVLVYKLIATKGYLGRKKKTCAKTNVEEGFASGPKIFFRIHPDVMNQRLKSKYR
jgi:hypothetical protein